MDRFPFPGKIKFQRPFAIAGHRRWPFNRQSDLTVLGNLILQLMQHKPAAGKLMAL
jgi:hypothetical protein